MTAPRLRADTGTEQPTSLLGEYRPTPGVRLTLHDRDGEVILLRHRKSAHAGSAAGIAAHVTHSGGVASRVIWDHWHTERRPVWMGVVEDWIAARIAAVWADAD